MGNYLFLVSLFSVFLVSGDPQFEKGQQDNQSLAGEWQFFWQELIKLPEEAKK